LLPKLNYRSLTLNEAISFLAEEVGAGPEYREQLELLVIYLRAAGLVAIENGQVVLVHRQPEQAPQLPSIKPSSPVFAGGGAQSQATAKLEITTGIHPSILGLIGELPSVGDSWTADEMEDFLSALKGTLKFIYKIKVEPNRGGQQ
jgi:hypothetical protein